MSAVNWFAPDFGGRVHIADSGSSLNPAEVDDETCGGETS